MADIAKKYQEQLPRIKENVKYSYDYFKENYDRFSKFKYFLYKSTLDEQQKEILKSLGKPELEFNILGAYVSRLLGEFSKQEPAIEVGASDDVINMNPLLDNQIQIVEGHIRHVVSESQKNGDAYLTYKDMLSGGFSVNKIRTDYINDNSFTQKIIWERINPLLCGFDVNAILPHKGDGKFCYELFPKTKEQFQQEYPDVNIDDIEYTRTVDTDVPSFNWAYTNEKNKVLIICDYYEKKIRPVKIVKLSTGETITMQDYKKIKDQIDQNGMLIQAPQIVQERMAPKEIICRYRFIANKVLEYVETDFKYLPLVFFDGDSELLQDGSNNNFKQFTKPYIYPAMGAQKLKDMVGQTCANEIENMVTHKWKVPVEGIPDQQEYREAYKDVQKSSVLMFKAYKDNDPDKPLPPPTEIPRIGMPPEVMATFSLTDQLCQGILGSYDASLGINNNQLSGVAIVEGATQSNAAAMPYIVGYLNSLNRIAEHFIDLIPKYYINPRVLPIINNQGKSDKVYVNTQNGINLNYGENDLSVKVEAGFNFSVQKSKALQMILLMAQSMPLFAQFLSTSGMEVVLDNLDIRGVDHLKMLFAQFKQQMQQQQAMQAQQAQQNPLMMKAQTEQAKIVQQNQQQAMQNENDKLKIIADMVDNKEKRAIEMERINTERVNQQIDIMSMKHKHLKDVHDIIDKDIDKSKNEKKEEMNEI